MKLTMPILAIVSIWAVSVHAQVSECTSIIEASRVVRIEYRNQQRFELYANNFCDEYSRTLRSTTDRSYGASYKFLSASVERRNASYDELATIFCSAEDSSRARGDVFSAYSQMIAPQAYSAYESCLKAVQSGGGPKVVPYITPNKTKISFSISDNRGEPAVFQGIVSEIFACRDHNGNSVNQAGEERAEMSLSSNALNIVCNRNGIECTPNSTNRLCTKRFPDGTRAYRHYPDGHLALNLSSGQHNMSFKAFDDGPPIVEFAVLQTQVRQLEERLPETRIHDLEERLPELSQRLETIFGDSWKDVEVNQVYQADSDGFLSAYCGGPGANAKFYLRTGESDTELDVRNRGGTFEGAVTPVKKGHYYEVDVHRGRSRFITAHWLPVKR